MSRIETELIFFFSIFQQLRNDFKFQIIAARTISTYINFQCDLLKKDLCRSKVIKQRTSICTIMDAILSKHIEYHIMTMLMTKLIHTDNAFLLIPICERIHTKLKSYGNDLPPISDEFIYLNSAIMLFNRWRQLMIHPANQKVYDERIRPMLKHLTILRLKLTPFTYCQHKFFENFSAAFSIKQIR